MKPALKNFWLFLPLLALLGRPACAQQGLQEMVFTAGTTVQDGSGRQWAYLLWQATSPALLGGKQFAVYAKPGDAGSLSPYERKAIVGPQTDPLVLAPLLSRSANVGENLAALDDALTRLFQKIMPPGALTLPQKLSAILRGAAGDPDHSNNLLLLAGLHPGVNLCLGTAHAELIAGVGRTTFEIREYDLPKAQDIAVIGRVTVTANAPILLSAPGRPVPVPEFPVDSAKGHLNVKLRWATPDELRRLSLLNYGFNVYRMTRIFAEMGNYHVTPPSNAVLRALAAGNPNVKQINRLPVLKSRDFDALTVLDFSPITGDTNTFFLSDDNGRFDPGGAPFINGAAYYYFITARDILGRDGMVSPGALVTICDRLPPLAPKGLRVENDYSFVGGVARQFLKVTWRQNANPPGDTTAAYHVYRWDSPGQMQATEANPLADPTVHRIAGPMAHVGGLATLSVVDDGAGAPGIATDAGRTFWYSVRAADDGACSPNFSGNSAPAFGVLRDRVGPDAPGGLVTIRCVRPVARYVDQTSQQGTQPDQLYHYRLTCQRLDTGIAWAEFFAFNPTAGNFIGRADFGDPTNTSVSVDFAVPPGTPGAGSIDFFCRVGSTSGRVSSFAIAPAIPPAPSAVRVVIFEGRTEVGPVNVDQTNARTTDCDTHETEPPGSTTTTPISICINLAPPMKEWKLYRRVDGGPLTLLRQDVTNVTAPVVIKTSDDALPSNLAELCYYAQVFDEHGNASPLAILACIRVFTPSTTPVPLLSPIDRSGTDISPGMALRWFCAPYGVDRFEVSLGDDGGGKKTLATPRVGPAFGPGPAFTFNVPVELGKRYSVFVKAMAAKGLLGNPSNTNTFQWSPALVGGPLVPWPARGLPRVTNFFAANIQAVCLTNPLVYQGVGVRIGEWLTISNQFSSQSPPPYTIVGAPADPMSYLYKSPLTASNLFPVVMYRYQVPNAKFPRVSGDIVQVSPLMEQIAYENFGGGIRIHDRFIALEAPPAAGGGGMPVKIYLVDTQPIVAGARYAYLLVRLAANREIDQVIETNELEVKP